MSVEQKVERNGWAIRVVAGDQKGGSNAEVTIHVGDEPTAAQIKSARKAVALAAERDRLAQELEDALDRAREAIAYLRIVLEGGHSGAAREFLARFPEKEDGA